MKPATKTTLFDWLTIVGGGIFAVALVILVANAAFAHEGPGFSHPIDCDDVIVPEGSTCYERSSYDGEQDVDHDFGSTYHVFHPVCEIVHPGEGSAAGRPEWVPCLPETGTNTSAAALLGGMALASGATMLILSGRRREGL